MAPFCIVYTCSPVLTSWYLFTPRKNFYGYSMSPARIKHTNILVQSAWYFSLFLTTFGFSWQIFIKVPIIKFYRNPSSGRHTDMCRQMDKWTKCQIPFHPKRVILRCSNVMSNNKSCLHYMQSAWYVFPVLTRFGVS